MNEDASAVKKGSYSCVHSFPESAPGIVEDDKKKRNKKDFMGRLYTDNQSALINKKKKNKQLDTPNFVLNKRKILARAQCQRKILGTAP